MKKMATIVVVSFAVTLAVIAGTRMSSEAVAVMMGMACGVVAGIPTSLLIAAVTQRRSGEGQGARMARDYPPVIVVQPGQSSTGYASSPYPLPPFSPGGTRQFRVVGEEATESVSDWGIRH